ncbi:mucin-17-like [Drosophila obscura]|uniref:mucin-17-like n=1 Tax=Drosophila obscura TaxID=7282 RepID=UPI001BB214C4|nr:mucin-17-like [Drosophila obscura]
MSLPGKEGFEPASNSAAQESSGDRQKYQSYSRKTKTSALPPKVTVPTPPHNYEEKTTQQPNELLGIPCRGEDKLASLKGDSLIYQPANSANAQHGRKNTERKDAGPPGRRDYEGGDPSSNSQGLDHTSIPKNGTSTETTATPLDTPRASLDTDNSTPDANENNGTSTKTTATQLDAPRASPSAGDSTPDAHKRTTAKATATPLDTPRASSCPRQSNLDNARNLETSVEEAATPLDTTRASRPTLKTTQSDPTRTMHTSLNHKRLCNNAPGIIPSSPDDERPSCSTRTTPRAHQHRTSP